LLRRKSPKKRAKKALQNETLQKALERASSQHFHKFDAARKDVPWEDLKNRAKAIRQESIRHLPELIRKFTQEAQKTGAVVYRASTPKDALQTIEKILRKRGARLVVKAKSMVSEEIGLNRFLEEKGYKVVETDLGEWIVQLAGERPSHITAPALHKTKEEVAKLIGEHLRLEVPSDPSEIVKLARKELRRYFIEADAGISGANLAVAETGSLVIVSNEGNARLVTSLPPVHIALVTAEKFVETLEQAATLIKALVLASSGLKLTAYVSFITGTSRTTDIEKQLVMGVHGPEEVHIIILDNGRLEAREDEDLEKALTCLKCGGCMLVCPVFQVLGGHVYGGPVYPGGIGLLLTAITDSIEKSSGGWDFCADCKKCEEFCPVGLPTGDLILRLKNRKGARLWEKTLSSFFWKPRLVDRGIKLLDTLHTPWNKNGTPINLPFSWAKGKALPAIKREKAPLSKIERGRKVYLFQGCLVKFFFPEIRRAVFSSLNFLGFQAVSPEDQVCCGAPSLHLGRKDDVIKLAKINHLSLCSENPDFIITVCPTGHALLKKDYPRLFPEFSVWTEKIFDFTDFVLQQDRLPHRENFQPPSDIFYHYPCHYLSGLGLREEPIKLLSSLGFNPVQEDEPFTCCGFCGIFAFKNPGISERLWDKKRGKIEKSGVFTIATDCPGCILQLRSSLEGGKLSFKVYHTAELVARRLEEISSKRDGEKSPDRSPASR
jgi:iron-sulfur cluster protein